ncbi:hypothetical protein QJS04_geneDACA003060 [Acorus gramineus]|uniref:Wall-associated receptor kinase galacturonan-binding domain-containing protein n=1 Tax=Acorus gramineus TaxID=55184 RepID=A0AAV9BWZ8_ACOGR|nr:hypothetical protein QJS04_geneDACA003060 [Acorus gramineus]
MSSLPLVLLSISTILLSFPFNIDGLSTQTCPSYPTCGSVDIRYPFWLIDPSHNTTTSNCGTTNCGYPTFGLTCKDNKFPLFRLSNKDYYLTYIDYNKNVIILLDIDFYYNPCPRPHQNFTISDNPILTFTQYAKPHFLLQLLHLPLQNNKHISPGLFRRSVVRDDGGVGEVQWVVLGLRGGGSRACDRVLGEQDLGFGRQFHQL